MLDIISDIRRNVNRMFKGQKSKLWGVFLLAVLLRLTGLFNIQLGGDFANHWEVAGGIAQGKSFPLLGPVASINSQIHLGPFYYYLLSIPHIIGQGNYKVAIIFFSILNSISIFPLFIVGKKWFGVMQSFMLVTLFAVSSYMVQVQNFPWNPYILPLIIILSLYVLDKLRDKKLLFLPVLALLLGFGVQSHATFFLIPIFLVFLPYRNISWKVGILSVCLFTLTLTPWLYSEFAGNFVQTKEIAATFSSHNETCDLYSYIKDHGKGERCFHQIRNTLFMFRMVSQSLFATHNLFFVVISFLITLFTFVKTKTPQKTFLITWIAGVFLFFMLYSQNIYLHFLLILIPIPFIIFTLFLEEVVRQEKHRPILFYLIYTSIICWNIIHTIYNLFSVRM
jgi:hypothetical protein